MQWRIAHLVEATSSYPLCTIYHCIFFSHIVNLLFLFFSYHAFPLELPIPPYDRRYWYPLTEENDRFCLLYLSFVGIPDSALVKLYLSSRIFWKYFLLIIPFGNRKNYWDLDINFAHCRSSHTYTRIQYMRLIYVPFIRS